MNWGMDWKVSFRGALRSFSMISHVSWGQCVIILFAFHALNFTANFTIHKMKRFQSLIQVQHTENRIFSAATTYWVTGNNTLFNFCSYNFRKEIRISQLITASCKTQEKQKKRHENEQNFINGWALPTTSGF